MDDSVICLFEPVSPDDEDYLDNIDGCRQFRGFKIGRQQFKLGDFAVIKKDKCQNIKSVIKKKPSVVQILRVIEKNGKKIAMVLWFLKAKHCKNVTLPRKAPPLYVENELLFDRRPLLCYIHLTAIQGTTTVITTHYLNSPKEILKKNPAFFIVRFALYENNGTLKVKPALLSPIDNAAEESVEVSQTAVVTSQILNTATVITQTAASKSTLVTRNSSYNLQSTSVAHNGKVIDVIATDSNTSPSPSKLNPIRTLRAREKLVIPESQDILSESTLESTPEDRLHQTRVIISQPHKRRLFNPLSQDISNKKHDPKNLPLATKSAQHIMNQPGPSEAVKMFPRCRGDRCSPTKTPPRTSVQLETRTNKRKYVSESPENSESQETQWTAQDLTYSPDKSPVCVRFTRKSIETTIAQPSKNTREISENVPGRDKKTQGFFNISQSTDTPVDLPFPKRAIKATVFSKAQSVDSDDEGSLFLDELSKQQNVQKPNAQKPITNWVKTKKSVIKKPPLFDNDHEDNSDFLDEPPTTQKSLKTATDVQRNDLSEDSDSSSTTPIQTQPLRIKMPRFVDENLGRGKNSIPPTDNFTHATTRNDQSQTNKKTPGELNKPSLIIRLSKKALKQPKTRSTAAATQKRNSPEKQNKNTGYVSSDNDLDEGFIFSEKGETKKVNITPKKSIFLEVNRPVPKPPIVTKRANFVDSSDDEMTKPTNFVDSSDDEMTKPTNFVDSSDDEMLSSDDTAFIDATPPFVPIQAARKSAQSVYSPARVHAQLVSARSPTRMQAQPSHVSPPRSSYCTRLNPIVRIKQLPDRIVKQLTGELRMSQHQSATSLQEKENPLHSTTMSPDKSFNGNTLGSNRRMKKTANNKASGGNIENIVTDSLSKLSSIDPVASSSGVKRSKSEQEIDDSDENLESDAENPLPKEYRKMLRSSPIPFDKSLQPTGESINELMQFLTAPTDNHTLSPQSNLRLLSLASTKLQTTHPVQKLIDKNLSIRYTSSGSESHDEEHSSKQRGLTSTAISNKSNLPRQSDNALSINSDSFHSTRSHFSGNSQLFGSPDSISHTSPMSQISTASTAMISNNESVKSFNSVATSYKTSNSQSPSTVNKISSHCRKQIIVSSEDEQSVITKSPCTQLPSRGVKLSNLQKKIGAALSATMDSKISVTMDTDATQSQLLEDDRVSQLDEEDYSHFIFNSHDKNTVRKSPRKLVSTQNKSSMLSSSSKCDKIISSSRISPKQVKDLLMGTSTEGISTRYKNFIPEARATLPDTKTTNSIQKKQNMKPNSAVITPIERNTDLTRNASKNKILEKDKIGEKSGALQQGAETNLDDEIKQEVSSSSYVCSSDSDSEPPFRKSARRSLELKRKMLDAEYNKKRKNMCLTQKHVASVSNKPVPTSAKETSEILANTFIPKENRSKRITRSQPSKKVIPSSTECTSKEQEKTKRVLRQPNKKSRTASNVLSPTKCAVIEEQEMPGRESELDTIMAFVQRKIEENSGGCMYISGVPGTGKTASVTQVVLQLQKLVREGHLSDFKLVKASGMELTQPLQIFSLMARELFGVKMSPSVAQTKLDAFFSNRDKKRLPTLLIIDELDMLCTRRQDVVYNLFDWPSKSQSRLTVLAIANTMDLPERLLKGRVTSRLGLTRLCFRPYTFEQLQQIVMTKLSEAKKFDEDALQLVARKVASVSGDARRAMDICKRAAEIAGHEKMVTMDDVMNTLNEMMSSPIVESIRGCSALAKHLLRCLLSEMKRTGLEESTLQAVFITMNESASFHYLPPCSLSLASDMIAKLASARLLRAVDSESGALNQQLALNISADELHYALSMDK